MSNRILKLYKGSTNGISGGVLKTIDDNGDLSAYALTAAGATVALEIYERSAPATVVVSITGTITDAANGIYDAEPTTADALDALTLGGEYYWRTRVTTTSDTVGKVFATDNHGRLLQVEVS